MIGRPTVRRVLAATVAAAGCATPMALASPAPPGPASPPARMLVYAQEWSLWPSRTSLPSGAVVVQLWNRGQDTHDLRIRRLRSGRMIGRAQAVATTQSGGLTQARWHLGPGRYELYCSLPGHLMHGMHTTIVVR